MKRKYVMCLALVFSMSTASFAEIQKTDSDHNLKMDKQRDTYSFTSKEALYLNLPTYPVSVNGENMDNTHLEYPFLTYKGITYMPLTYNLTRCLGIETAWTAETGLALNFTNISAEYQPQLKKTQNAKRVKVQVPQYPILVNGTPLNKEDVYPCFVYNNIVYLPLTSTLVQNELNAKIEYDLQTGLSITSTNPSIKRVKKGSTDLNASDALKTVQVYNGYIYYIDSQNQVMVQPADLDLEPKAFETINEVCSHYEQGDFLGRVGLKIKDNHVLMTCHVGGALMGSDLVYELFEDGSSKLISSNYDIVVQFEDFNIRYWGGPLVYQGNLKIAIFGDFEAKVSDEFVSENDDSIPENDELYEPLGSPDVLYGWDWYEKDGSAGGSPSGPVILRGDVLYLLGYDRVNGDHTSIYKVNYKTNESKALISRTVESFINVGDDLYYKSPLTEFRDVFYRYNIKTQKDEIVYQSDGKLYEYAFLGTHLYFVDDKQRLNMVLDKNKCQSLPSTESSICEGIKRFNAKETYLVSVFTEAADSRYRIVVLNEAEEIVFKTSDYAKLEAISIDGDILYYINDTSGDLCSVSLKALEEKEKE